MGNFSLASSDADYWVSRRVTHSLVTLRGNAGVSGTGQV